MFPIRANNGNVINYIHDTFKKAIYAYVSIFFIDVCFLKYIFDHPSPHVDDLYTFRELFELMSTAKQQRGDSVDSSQLIELLVHKDKELHATLQTGT